MFDPRRVRQHSFMEIDYKIFLRSFLILALILEGQLSVSSKRKYWLTFRGLSLPRKVQLGKMTLMGLLGLETLTQKLTPLHWVEWGGGAVEGQGRECWKYSEITGCHES